MSAPAIRAQDLWKEYAIGAHAGSQTFREALTDAIAAPFRRLREMGSELPTGQQLWALRDVGFTVQPGEVVGIIGRNGAGKSTLLKILSRITAPTQGEVQIRGRIASLLEVGTGFHPELTGRENIRLNGAILGMSGGEIRAKLDEIVAFADIERFLDTPVKRYSSGMYVRLAFAVAAHLEPEILIIDEVLAVGDVEFQRKCLGKMGEVARGGRTVLFVSHNADAVLAFCDRAILLDRGTLVGDGRPADVIGAYFKRYLGRNTQPGGLRAIPRTFQKHASITITDLTVNRGGNLHQEAPAIFDIHVEITAPMRAVVFGIGFANSSGGRILSCDSDYGHAPPLSFEKPGSYCVTLKVPSLNLAPAEYFIDVGCRSTGLQAFDGLTQALNVRVLPQKNALTQHLQSHATALITGEWEARSHVEASEDMSA